MELIIILILLFFIWKHFKKKKQNAEENLDVPPSATNVKQVKQFQEQLKKAEGYGPEAINAMGTVATLYAFGSGVEKNLAKTAEWYFKQLDSMLQLKVYWDLLSFSDFSSAYDSAYEFFMNGELFPPNLPCAWHLAATLLEAGDQRSALLVDELQAMDEIGIGKVKTSEEAVEIYKREAEKGNTFAMVRLAASLSLTLNENSLAQAKSLVEQAANAGNLRAQYALGKQLDLTVPFSKLKVLYLTERLARISAEEKELNLLDEEMKKANVLSSTEAQVDWLLSKAQWPAATAYQEPASLPEQKEAFMKARALEQKGNNFKKVVKLYKPVAEAGDVEAMRRLGNILINFRSSYTGDAAYLEGREWLKKAAASSVLAQYNLGFKHSHPAEMAALARSGNTEALYYLSEMMLNGWGGPKNHIIGQKLTKITWELLGHPEKTGDGEGMEWKRKLCLLQNRYGEDDQLFWAEHGKRIDYGPSCYAFALTRFARKSGPDFQLEYANKAYSSGIEKAYNIATFLRSEKNSWSQYVNNELNAALNKKGYLANSPYSGEQLVQLKKATLTKNKNAYEQALQMEGLPSLSDIEKGIIHENVDLSENVRAAEMENTRNTSTVTIDDMPMYIYDQNGHEWEKDTYLGDSVRYRMAASNFVGQDETQMKTEYGNYFTQGTGLQGDIYLSNHHITSSNTADTMMLHFHW